jgi:hypothetical protein
VIPYLMLYLLVALCTVAEWKTNTKRPMIICIIAMTAMAGFRFETGYDWYAYELFFSDVDPIASIIANPQLTTAYPFEIGYTLLNSLVKTVGGDLSLVFLIAAVIHSFGIGLYISRWSAKPMCVLLAYLAVCYLMAQFIVVRFAIAAGFLFITLDRFYCRKYLSAAIFFIAALSFHVSSLMFLVVPLLGLRKYATAAVIFACIFPALGFVAATSSQQLVVSMLAGVLNVLSAGFLNGFTAKLNMYVDFVSDVSPVSLAFAVFNLIFFFAFNYHTKNSNGSAEGGRHEIAIRGLTVLMILSMLLLPNLQTVWNRVMLIAFPVQMLWLVNAFRHAPELRERQIYVCAYLGSTAIFSFMLFNPSPNLFIPYESTLGVTLFGSSGENRIKMLSHF